MIKKENRWPIGLSIVILGFILFFAGFFIFARINRIELVEDDYYKKELAYQDQIERMERSKRLSEAVSLLYDETGRKVELRFPAEIDPEEISGNIMFFRPSDAKQDQLLPLQLSFNRTQSLDVERMPAGRWKVKVFWATGKVEYYDEFEIFLR